MAGSRFDYCAFVGSSEPNICERTYNALRENLGEAFQGPVQDAVTYGTAMTLGLAKLQLEGAAAQCNPTDCNALLGAVERDFKIIPTHGQSVNERQAALLAAKTLASGATESNIETGIRAILGSAFVNWRALDTDEEATVNSGDNQDVNWIVEPSVATSSVQADSRGICYMENIKTWVSVAYSGATTRVSVSYDDGKTFAPLVSSPLKPWTSVAWGSVGNVTLAVAVGETSGGDAESVMTSPDGVNWTLQTAIVGLWKKVVFWRGAWYAVGSSVAMRSVDGVSWTNLPCSARAWTSLAAGRDGLVAVASDGYIMQFSNTRVVVSWSASVVSAGVWNDIAAGNGVYVRVTHSGAWSAQWSDDFGATWNNANIPTRDIYAVSFCDGMFFCAPIGANAYEYWTSKDGKTWTARTWLVGGHQIQNIAARANRFVGVAYSGATIRVKAIPQLKVSPDYVELKHVALNGPIFPGSRTVSYTAIAAANPLLAGEWITVEPGRIGLQERIQITASTPTTITATFTQAHSDGVRATTAPWPTWRSTKRHSLISVNDASVFTNLTLRAAVSVFMRRVMPAASTWSITGTGYSGPFLVGASVVGIGTIGAITTSDP